VSVIQEEGTGGLEEGGGRGGLGKDSREGDFEKEEEVFAGSG